MSKTAKGKTSSPPAPPKPDPSNAIDVLCPACGLCCNGVLFADVKLQPIDKPAQFQANGINVVRKGTRPALPQPCACFDGKLCRIYPDRPNRCRAFECRLLQNVQSGTTKMPTALNTISLARRQSEHVLSLLRSLGQHDEHLPLTKRYAKLMAEPIDLSAGTTSLRKRSQLMNAMSKLMHLLENHFLH